MRLTGTGLKIGALVFIQVLLGIISVFTEVTHTFGIADFVIFLIHALWWTSSVIVGVGGIMFSIIWFIENADRIAEWLNEVFFDERI